jgi:hypothetical protein
MYNDEVLDITSEQEVIVTALEPTSYHSKGQTYSASLLTYEEGGVAKTGLMFNVDDSGQSGVLTNNHTKYFKVLDATPEEIEVFKEFERELQADGDDLPF